MNINFSILPSNELDVSEADNTNVDLDNYEAAEEDNLYILISDNPEEPNTLFFKGEFYSINSTNFKISYIENEAVIFDDKESRLYPQPLANPGSIKTILSHTTRRCRPGYHLVCYTDGAGNRRCRCVKNN